MMRNLIIVSIGALFAASPALAQDEKTGVGKTVWEQHSDMLEQEGQNREKGEDGTFQGKPVVRGPANFSTANADARTGSAASGESAGETGSEETPSRR